MSAQGVAQSVPEAFCSQPMVYFVGSENGLVKIGFAQDFDNRLGRLVCGSPVSLVPLATVEGGRMEERAYHERFKQWRRHGEWFELVPEIQAEIDRINAEWHFRITGEMLPAQEML